MDNSTKLFVLELVKINRAQAMKDRIRWSEKVLKLRRPKKTLGSNMANIFDDEGNMEVIDNGYWIYKDNCGMFSFTWQMGRDSEWEFASFWTFQMVNESYRRTGLMLSIDNIKSFNEDFNGIIGDNEPELGGLIGRRHPRHNWYSEMEDRINRYRDFQRHIYIDSDIYAEYDSDFHFSDIE